MTTHETKAGPFVMRPIKASGAWWIKNDVTPDVPEWGPYATRADADEAIRGMLATINRSPHIFKK